MPQTYGIDISSWQSGINPTASQVPLGFAIFKSSEGAAPDTRYRQFVAQSRGKIPIIGAYHYFKTGTDLVTQIKTVLGATSGTNPNFYAVDFEQTGNILSPKAAANTLVMIDTLHAITGKPVYLYTNQSLYQQYFKGASVPLWLSAPSGLSINARPTFIQTVLNSPGARFGVSGGSADVDVFQGTPSQLSQALGADAASIPNSGVPLAQTLGLPGTGASTGDNNVPSNSQPASTAGINISLLPQSVSNFISGPDLAITVGFWIIGLMLIWIGFGMLIAPAVAPVVVKVAGPVAKGAVKAALV